jgi:hypothetical protein
MYTPKPRGEHLSDLSAYAMRQTSGRKRRRFYTTLGRIERQRKIGDAHGSAVRARRSTGTLIRPRRFGTPSASLGTIKSVATDSGQPALRDALLVGPPRKRTMVHTITPTTDDKHSSSTEIGSTSNTPGFTSNALGRKKTRYRRSTSRIDGGGVGYVQYVQGNRLPFAYAILSLSSCLVPEGMGVTLDVLDVTLYWRQNSKERVSITNPYVQYQKSYLGRGWTFKKGVAA